MAALAMRTLEQVADAQTARNSCFPDAATSPIIGYLLLSTTAAVQNLLQFPDNPMKELCVNLVQLFMMLGPMANEATSAFAENDFIWTDGESHPTVEEFNRSLEDLRQEMESAKDRMVRWRIGLDFDKGIRFDRHLHSAVLTIEELRYYDLFTVLNLVQTNLKAYQWHMQMALVELQRDRSQAPEVTGQLTQ